MRMPETIPVYALGVKPKDGLAGVSPWLTDEYLRHRPGKSRFGLWANGARVYWGDRHSLKYLSRCRRRCYSWRPIGCWWKITKESSDPSYRRALVDGDQDFQRSQRSLLHCAKEHHMPYANVHGVNL